VGDFEDRVVMKIWSVLFSWAIERGVNRKNKAVREILLTCCYIGSRSVITRYLQHFSKI